MGALFLAFSEVLTLPGTFSGEVVEFSGNYFLSSAGKVPYRADSGDGVVILSKKLVPVSFIRTPGDVLGFWKREGSLYVFVLGKGIFLYSDGALIKVKSVVITSPPSSGGNVVFFGTPQGVAYFDGRSVKEVSTGFPVLSLRSWDSWVAVLGEKFQIYQVLGTESSISLALVYSENVVGEVGAGYQRVASSGELVAYVTNSQLRVFKVGSEGVHKLLDSSVYGARAVVLSDVTGTGDPLAVVGGRGEVVVFRSSGEEFEVSGTVMGFDVLNVNGDFKEEVAVATTSGVYILSDKGLKQLRAFRGTFLFKPSSLSSSEGLLLMAGDTSGELLVFNFSGFAVEGRSYSSGESRKIAPEIEFTEGERSPASSVYQGWEKHVKKKVIIVDTFSNLTSDYIESKLGFLPGEGSCFLTGSRATSSELLKKIATGDFDAVIIHAPLKKIGDEVFPILVDTDTEDLESTSIPLDYLKEVFEEVYTL